MGQSQRKCPITPKHHKAPSDGVVCGRLCEPYWAPFAFHVPPRGHQSLIKEGLHNTKPPNTKYMFTTIRKYVHIHMYTSKLFSPTEQATQIYVSPSEVQTGLRETCPTMANDQIWKLHKILLRIWKTPAFCSGLAQIHSFGKLHSAFVFEHPGCCDKSLTPLNPGWAWFSDFWCSWMW